MEIACLDLGSNTFHLQHLRVSHHGFETVLDHKHSVRLGDGVSRTGGIDARGWREGHAAVADLLARSHARRPDRQVAVATSAVRSAGNGQKFLDELRSSFELDVTLLSPEREAELSYLGATTDPRVGGRRVAVIDLGGGSTELALGQGASCLYADSLAIGTLRLCAELGERPLDRASAAALTRTLRLRFARKLASLAALEPERVVFASGVARAVRGLALHGTELAGPTGLLDVMHLQLSLERNLGRDAGALVQQGVDPARADSVLIAHLVMIALCEGLGARSVHVTSQGLRAGMALQEFRRARTQAPRPQAAAWHGARGSRAFEI
jgi:exopolyphosphatase/guanosine-5'-triphosphate,3'-diphosphate pyrophosphatase